jgi:adenylosuccinate synthase
MNHAILNVDGLFGDSGKGTTVDFLSREHNSTLTVRFNGGAQAAHNVVLPDGRHHTFAQFGAATFIPGVKTYLSQYVLVNPLAMAKEEEHLQTCNVNDAWKRMFIHKDALITTPYHRADNRIKELFRGSKMHGSCGMGISATVEDSLKRPDECLRIKDLLNDNELLRKLKLNRLAMIESTKNFIIPNEPLMDNEISTFDEDLINEIFNRLKSFREKVTIVDTEEADKLLFKKSETVVFEPAQGVLLDENYGFHPYTTWTTCTLKNAKSILSEIGYKGKVEKYMVLRTFATRHGPGPFPTEDAELTTKLADPYNTINIWQKGFRCGNLDTVLLDYALRANGKVNGLSVTHLDWTLKKKNKWMVCTKYELDKKKWIPPIPKSIEEQETLTKNLERVVPVYEEYVSDDILPLIENKLRTQIKIVSYGPTYKQKDWVR